MENSKLQNVNKKLMHTKINAMTLLKPTILSSTNL